MLEPKLTAIHIDFFFTPIVSNSMKIVFKDHRSGFFQRLFLCFANSSVFVQKLLASFMVFFISCLFDHSHSSAV